MRGGSELVTVTVFDKDAWSAGGKVKVTRSKRGPEAVMAGCLFFSAVGGKFREQVDRWVRRGAAQPYASNKIGVVDGGGVFFPFDCYPYNMANPWALSAFEGFKKLGPKAGESVSGGAYPDMRHGYMWDRVMGGTEDAVNSLRRAEEQLELAKMQGDMSGNVCVCVCVCVRVCVYI